MDVVPAYRNCKSKSVRPMDQFMIELLGRQARHQGRQDFSVHGLSHTATYRRKLSVQSVVKRIGRAQCTTGHTGRTSAVSFFWRAKRSQALSDINGTVMLYFADFLSVYFPSDPQGELHRGASLSISVKRRRSFTPCVVRLLFSFCLRFWSRQIPAHTRGPKALHAWRVPGSVR